MEIGLGLGKYGCSESINQKYVSRRFIGLNRVHVFLCFQGDKVPKTDVLDKAGGGFLCNSRCEYQLACLIGLLLARTAGLLANWEVGK